MKFVKVIIFFVLITLLTCQAATTNNSQIINSNYEKFIEGSIDLVADPCENFYQYACGEWETQHSDAEDKYTEILSLANYKANKEMKRYMKKLKLNDQPKFMRTTNAFYKSCLYVDEYDHLNYIEWMKNHANLTWPLPWSEGEAEKKQHDWVYTLAVMRRYGLNGILIEETMVNKKDEPTKLIMDLDKPVENEGFQNMTYENLEVLIQSINITLNSTKLDKLWLEISEFEERLVALDEINDEEGQTKITVDELPLTWLSTYIGIILNKSSLDPKLELYIQNVDYLKALDNLLDQYDGSFICKYLGIRFLWHLHLNGPSGFFSMDCIDATRSLLPMPMNWMYEQHHPELPHETAEVQKIFDNILRTFNQTLKTNRMGFSASIQQYLLDKLNSLKLKVGNLPRINTVQILESYYQELQLNTSDFYGNHLKLLRFYFIKLHSEIPAAVHLNASQFFNLETYDTASSSTPYYLPRENIVLVPITVIRQPVYHSQYDNVYAYSSLGSVLAHEIFHSFDYTGLEIDPIGKTNTQLYNKIFENPKFDHSYNCLRDIDPDVVDEKIADIIGLRYAYDAFANLHPEGVHTKTRIMKGVKMSLQQLFFLNFAQYYCDTSEEDSDHGLAKDRVNDALSQIKEFTMAYGCKSKSGMQRGEICELW